MIIILFCYDISVVAKWISAEFYKVMRENALETGNATREELIGLRKEADI